MAGWNRIGCAVDFSDVSRFAMEEAADLARTFEAELVLLHVHDPRPRIGAGGMEWSRLPFALAAVDLERDVAVWRCEAERRTRRRVRSLVLAGDPAEEIIRIARELALDVLVIGTHGRTRLERFALGSVAERVVRLAPCPVLVVRETEPRAYQAMPAWRRAV